MEEKKEFDEATQPNPIPTKEKGGRKKPAVQLFYKILAPTINGRQKLDAGIYRDPGQELLEFARQNPGVAKIIEE